MIKETNNNLINAYEIMNKNWEKYEKYKDCAEQHMFSTIAAFDFKLIPLYKDLQINKSSYHAMLLNMYLEKAVFPILGIN